MHILRSSREIAQMRKAGLLVWQAHQLAGTLVKPGVTTGEIDAAVEKFFLDNDAIPLFKGVPGKVPFPAVTCISVNEEVVHGIPGPRVLREGDVVSIDTGCKLDGWCGDSAVTHPVGKVAAEVQRLLDVTSGVLELAIELMGLKRRWSEVATEMGSYVRDQRLLRSSRVSSATASAAKCTKTPRSPILSAPSCAATAIFRSSRAW